MGAIDSIRRKFGRWNKHERAAKQLYEQLVARGTGIEIPASLSLEDDITNMVLAFRELYGDRVEVAMLQSKSIVLKAKKPEAVSTEAWSMLQKGGYFPGKEFNPEMFLTAHEQFMARNNYAREDAEKAAVKEREETTALGDVTGRGG